MEAEAGCAACSASAWRVDFALQAALDFTPLKPDELHLAMLATEHPAIQASHRFR